MIISEPMGYMLFNERMLETFLHAKKWLKPGGGVVWCGVVWCGVVWCGVVWCGGGGVVWCGVVWCGVVWCGGGGVVVVMVLG